MRQQLNIPFSIEGQQDITNIKDLNESFATGTLKIMYTGKNQNGSSISKEAVMKALPSLYNVPIVANYIREDDEIGGHDIDIVHQGNDLKLINLTQPCGVIPEHAKFHFDVLLDDSGVCHEYLVADDVILWKRQEIYDVLMNRYNGEISHSMEIDVNNGFLNIEEEVYQIEDFTFTALCLLGNCQPCFEGSKLTVNQQTFSASMNQMLAELKEAFASLTKEATSNDVADMNTKGGLEMSEENKELEVAEEALEAENVFEEEAAEANDEDDPEFAAIKKKADDAYDLIEPAVNEKDYWLLNIEWSKVDGAEEYKAIVQSKKDHKAYALKAFIDANGLTVDWENPVAKAFAIVDADSPMGYEELPGTAKLLAENHDLSVKVLDFDEKFKVINTELEELRAFKSGIENDQANADREELYAKFEDLEGLEEFEALKEKASEFDLETLEEKLYAIRGKSIRKENFSAHRPVGVRLGIKAEKKSEKDPYGSLFKRYNVEEE